MISMTAEEIAKLTRETLTTGPTTRILKKIDEIDKEMNSIIAELPDCEQKQRLKRLNKKLAMIAVMNLAAAKAGLNFLKTGLPSFVEDSENAMLEDLTKKMDLL